MKDKTPLLLMEQLIMILIFALTAALCLRGFTYAVKLSMEIRQQEYDIVYKEFQQELEENPIKVGSHTYESKRGYDGLLKLWEDVGKITGLLESMAENGTTPDAVSYQYIAYQPTLSKDLAEYSAAFSLISGSDYMLDTEEETETEITTRKNE